MTKDFVIIGGGVAGLCAAIRLAELGIEPLVLEGGVYPSHKTCGEFLSPECLNILHGWDIRTHPIYGANLRTPTQNLSFKFPQPAGSLSHITLDPALARRAQSFGVEIRSNTSVQSFHPKREGKGAHVIELIGGEKIHTRSVIVATGRIPGYNKTKPPLPYIGMKAHFKEMPTKDNLEMFAFAGAYMGIAQVEGGSFNVACLMDRKAADQEGGPERFIKILTERNSLLAEYFAASRQAFPWMRADIPEFGIKDTPKWLDTYFIGDAAATIPPATGNGLSMAILGGCLVAEYAVKGHFEEFRLEWKQRYASRIRWGKLLHKVMLSSPLISSACLKLGHTCPILADYVFSKTRRTAGSLGRRTS
jgi:flavin-dependent dehydrogenase